MKIKLNYYIVIFILILLIPFSAYIDYIQLGYHSYINYFALSCWEGGLVLFGIVIGSLIKDNSPKETNG